MFRSLFASGSVARPTLASSSKLGARPSSVAQRVEQSAILTQVRYRSDLAPRRTKYRKAHKGRVSLPIGGSLKGSSLLHGGYGLRLLASARLTASQLTSCLVSIKRKIKPVKGAEAWMRVFPDVPVCVKGNETRMGKGKGGFEYWACRVPMGRVVFEVAGGNIREEIAKESLRLAAAKLPVGSEFISTASSPRLGSLTNEFLTPPLGADTPPALSEAADSDIAAELAGGQVKGVGQGGAYKVVGARMDRVLERQRIMEEITV